MQTGSGVLIMKKVFAAGLLLLCTLLIGVIFFSAVRNKYINKTNLGVFGLPRLLTICTEMSLKDKQTAEKIIETARTVFEYTGSYDNSNKKNYFFFLSFLSLNNK